MSVPIYIWSGGLSGPQNAFGVSSVDSLAKTEEQNWEILMLA